MKKNCCILLFSIFTINVTAQDVKPTTDSIFTKVEAEIAFPGGDQVWRNFLVRNLNIEVPYNNGARPRKYTVVIQFVVDTAGNISDIKPLTNHGYGMEEEVMRVISKAPKWIPALINGRKVKAYRKQPVTFLVSPD